MKLRFGPAVVVTLLACGCTGETGGAVGDRSVKQLDRQPPGDPFAPCIDPARCCGPENTVCDGDPDTGGTCKCTGLWACRHEATVCQQELPVPPGGGSWTCTWSAQLYTCKGSPPAKPPGSGGWSCTQNQADKLWTCTKSPPNPTNSPSGTAAWSCSLDTEPGLIVCERKGRPPAPDLGSPPPPDEHCANGVDDDGDQLIDCMDPDCPPCPPPTCPPGQECCDGKDNDGDGKVDEGNVCGFLGSKEPCPPGALQICDCYCGVHRRCRADGTWGPCLVDFTCAPATITSQSQCGPGQFCDYGMCVSATFKGSQCVHHTDCPVGKVCDMGSCVPDTYAPWNCSPPP